MNSLRVFTHLCKAFKPLVVFTLVFFAACAPAKREQITDRAGNVVEKPPRIERIISTTPANTEIIAALGKAGRLVAYDKYSREIDGVPDGLPILDMMNPDVEAILECNPDLLIAHSLNKVNAADDPFSVLKNVGICVVYVPMSSSIDGIYEDIRFIAGVLSAEERGEEIIAKMKNEIDALHAVAQTITEQRSVYFEIEPAPYCTTMGGGTYLDEMLAIVGAKNIFGDVKGVVFPNAEEIIMRNPDVMITNYSYNKNAAEEMRTRKGFEHTNAVKNNAVYLIDADTSSRPSHRIVLALHTIARCVYPEYYGAL